MSPSQMDALFAEARGVSILDILDDYFGIRLSAGTRSWKILCPWTFEHKHPSEKSYRVYPDTNTSFCFAMHGPLDPVDLVVRASGVSRFVAARQLLRHYGKGGQTWQERYNEVILETEKARHLSRGDISAAVNLRLSRVSGYEDCRYHDDVVQTLHVQLDKPADGWTVTRLTEWLDETERVVDLAVRRAMASEGRSS